MPRPPKASPRRRLDAEAARRLILDVAEKRLVDVGPAGIRLQEIAADAGVSHPTVLHHFGSRELLVQAVIARSLSAIQASVIQALGAAGDDAAQLEVLLDKVALALERTGHARVMLWLALEGHDFHDDEVRLTDVVGVAHAIRTSRNASRTNRPSREDTARTVVLAALALVGGSVLGPKLLERAGLAADAKEPARFRRWFLRLLLDHFEH